MPDLAPPGLDPDIPVNAALVAAAREGARTAISAAERLLAGDRFAYAVCRPPGHHAGPGFIGGYCYLNNAAAAVQTLREGGMRPIGVLDLDLHYPNGTSELVERMGADATLHSLHASPVTNVAAGTELPRAPGERAVAFASPPDPLAYLAEVESSVATLADDAAALVVSIGYDTVAGDPHGGWGFGPEVFAGVGRLLDAAGLPVCIVQEGGYSLPTPGRLRPRLRRRPARGGPGMSATRSAPAPPAPSSAARASPTAWRPFRARLDVIDD